MAVGVILVIVVIAVVCFLVILKNMLYICEPNEVLIFSGGKRVTGDERRGYRIIKGGRAIRIPLFEAVDKMNLTNISIDVSVTNAYSKGGIPLIVNGVANVKIAGHEPTICNAIERFLGHSMDEIEKIAKETLEGNLRGVLATLTPEQVNEDKQAFAQSLTEEAEQDLTKLGLVLDSLKIQNISDDVGYLDSIGRKQSAEVQKRALIAEAHSKADSLMTEAKNQEGKYLSEIDAQINIVKAEVQRRIVDAQTKKVAMVAEEQGTIVSALAKAKADLEVQKARIEEVKRRLEADVIEPAMAEMSARTEQAKAQAAPIIEEGKAKVAALKEISSMWVKAGPSARDIFLMHKLDALLKSLVSTISDLKIDKMTIIGGSHNGTSMAGLVTKSEELKATLGVDLPAVVNDVVARFKAAPKNPPSLPAK